MKKLNTQPFRLSPQYQLVEKTDIEPITLLEGQEPYILLDNDSEDELLLNTAIYTFLKQFETPTTLYNVTQYFAQQTQATAAEVAPIVLDFFETMRQRHVLIPAADYEKRQRRPKPLDIGTDIGGFKIVKSLSLSPPIEVCLAQNTQDQQQFILKILRKPPKLSPKHFAEWQQEFRQEFRIMEKLKGHPHICQLLNLQDDYAVLEYIEGKSLRGMMEDATPPLLSVRLNWLSQIFDALGFIHNKGILHGDLHTSNFLISTDSTVKIIDFDLACFAHEAEAEDTGGGIRSFIPPERISTNAFDFVASAPDFRSEVHQIGVVAYFTIYGKLPFEEPTWKRLAQAILENKPVLGDKTPFDEFVPPSVRVFLQKCLEKNPDARFASATEMHRVWQSVKTAVFVSLTPLSN